MEAAPLRLKDRLQSGPAGERVYATLRAAIVSARLEPGRQLSENELARQLGVSRTPVREALARLRDEGLVAIVPQLGTFVTRIDEDDVADAAFVREALECAAVRLAAERVDGAGLTALQAGLEAQQQAVGSGDSERFDELDRELHRSLAELGGRPIAWRLGLRASGQLDRVRGLSLPSPGYLGEMLEEHGAIVAAIADGDADRAERDLRHHLRMVLSLLPELREHHPDFFAAAT